MIASERADRLASLIAAVADRPLDDVAARQLREELEAIYDRLDKCVTMKEDDDGSPRTY